MLPEPPLSPPVADEPERGPVEGMGMRARMQDLELRILQGFGLGEGRSPFSAHEPAVQPDTHLLRR